MNRKQKIIVSITGITVVMLALLGLTYGYYLTNIYGNTNSNSISVTTADLKLTYRDGTGELIASGVMPGEEITSKTFTVKNDGTNDIDAYTVALINIINNFTFKDDLEVSVSCSSNINNGKCDGFAEEYENNIYKEKYPAVNSELFSLGIKKDEIHTYTLTVDYLYQEFDQSDDMGKTLKGKVQIYDPKDTIEVSGEVTGASEGDYAEIHSDIQTSEIVDGKYKFIGIPADNHEVFIKNRETGTEKSTTLEIKKGQSESTTNNIITFIDTSKVANVTIDTSNANLSTTVNKVSDGKQLLRETIMNDSRITKNTGTPSFTGIADYKVTGDSTSGEIGMYSAEDDYGTSWYFRGAQSYNYVSFAGFIWRIVRINGNDTIRLILDQGINDVTTDPEFANKSQFIISANHNSYMHGNDLPQVFLEGISYEEALLTAFNNQNDSNAKIIIDSFYEKYLINYKERISDTLFCGDKTLSEISDSYHQMMNVNFSGISRLVTTNPIPTLKCAFGSGSTPSNEKINLYSRYTVDVQTIKNGAITNGDLDYPIALLSADELLFAGAYTSQSNNEYYLNYNKGNDFWWTMTPGNLSSGSDHKIIVSITTNSISRMMLVTNFGVIRPVINLNNNVLILSGNGTIDQPYVIE